MEFFEATEQIGPVRLLKISFVAYPVVNALHIAAIGMLLASVVLLDLRLLGALRSMPEAAFVAAFRKIAVWAFAAAVLVAQNLGARRPGCGERHDDGAAATSSSSAASPRLRSRCRCLCGCARRRVLHSRATGRRWRLSGQQRGRAEHQRCDESDSCGSHRRDPLGRKRRPRRSAVGGVVRVTISAEAFLLRLPKVELHVHLEGTFRPATLLHLAKKNGVPLPADDEAGIRQWFRFRDFDQFIEIYVTCSKCLVEPEDFKLLAIFIDVFDGFFRHLNQLLLDHGVTAHEDEFWSLVAACAAEYQAAHPQLAHKFERYDLFAEDFAHSCLNRLQIANNQHMLNLEDPASGLQFAGRLANPLAPWRDPATLDQ